MKTLWLVRHSKSAWDINGLADIDRPLNDRGYSDAHEMAERLKKNIGHTLLVTSPAIRSVSTALIFSRHLNIDPAHIQIRQTLYGSGREHYLAVIAALPEEHSSVMIFGHNPVISETLNFLAGTAMAEIPTTGIAAIGFEEPGWRKAAEHGGKLVLFDFPKNKGKGNS